MINYMKMSLTRQLLVAMILFFIIFLWGALMYMGLLLNLRTEYEEQFTQIQGKLDIADQLQLQYDELFFEVRGYIAYRRIELLDYVENRQAEIQRLIQDHMKVSSTVQEEKLLDELMVFNDYYFNQSMPQVMSYVKDNRIDLLTEFSETGGTKVVVDTKALLQNYSTNLNKQIKSLGIKLDADREDVHLLFFAFLAFMFLLMFLLARLMLIRIVRPVQELALASEQLGSGNEVRQLVELDRQDEIGRLSKSFLNMISRIQDNQQELLQQNEELEAQQDELQLQQEELQGAIDKMQETEKVTQSRNELVRAISNTLNKSELLKNIIHSMSHVAQADQGMIVLLNEALDHAYIGISKNGSQRILEHIEDSIVQRIIAERTYHCVVRSSEAYEQGYHEGMSISSDLYIPIESEHEAIGAFIILTRLGRSFTSDEQEEYALLTKQISVSLDKLKLYEDTENERAMTQDILNTIHEGIQLVNTDGYIIRVNSMMYDMIDSKEGLETNTTIEHFLQKMSEAVVDADELKKFMLKVISGKCAADERYIYEITKPQKRMIQVYFETLTRGNGKYDIIFVHRDITKEYELDQMKSDFVSTVSHELRTPLSSVLGFAEMLINKPLNPERQKKYLETIYQEAQRLTTLINDFLDIQRMELGKLIYEKNYIDLIPVIEEVIQMQQISSSQHTFVIDAQTSHTYILGDRDKIKQVFMNMINNAVKYSPSGGLVELILIQQEKLLIIDIKDQGLGIPEEALPKLFTKFYRVDNSDHRKIGGTGLGLSIVREIVQAHQGEITINSVLGEGTTFTISLPMVKQDTPTSNWNKEGMIKDNHPFIILVEDDQSLASLLREELTSSGCHVLHYTSGSAAIEAIQNVVPDAVVLDLLLMDDMDGWGLLQHMKNTKELQHIPVFVSTALDEKEKAMLLGATHFLLKPYKLSTLSEIILRTLKKS